MNHGRTVALIGIAACAMSLAACGKSGGGGDGAASNGGPSAPQKDPRTTAPVTAGPLTPPGTHLALGQEATVAWVPSSASITKAQKGLKLQVAVTSIEKGSIADFTNVQLDADQKASTPYYVTVRLTALGSIAPGGNEDPDVTFEAIDDRGQRQGSITFFGTFDRCDDKTAPKPFVNGKSYESCFAYLMPGGGSIKKVQWANGPWKADDVSPYYDKPLVWQGA
jgi:hypothetical protein